MVIGTNFPEPEQGYLSMFPPSTKHDLELGKT